MFFFKRRKKEKTLENKFDELNEGILNEKDRENPHKVEHYVIERLEQMIETTKEIEDEKAEYKVVTSYLNDIQTLEGLTEEEKKPITDIAAGDTFKTDCNCSGNRFAGTPDSYNRLYNI